MAVLKNLLRQTSIFVKHGHDLADLSTASTPAALKDHPQIPLIIDALSRKERHHVALLGSFSEKINLALMQAIAQNLQGDNLPKALRDIEFIYFDTTDFENSTESSKQIDQDFTELCAQLATSHKRIIFGINQLLADEAQTALYCLEKKLKSMLADEQWRFIVITQRSKFQSREAQHGYLNRYFNPIRLIDPSETDTLSILKTYKASLESFHHVMIPDECFAYAYDLASYYVSGRQPVIDKALELLDSSAARASATERDEQHSSVKPVVTNHIIASVVSSWTKIPLSHLQTNKFKANEFVQAMQRQVHGQEAAITQIGLVMQHARIRFQERKGPVCSLLFAGPANVGKTETAYTMAEQMFGHKRALLHVNLDRTHIPTSLADVKIMARSDEDRCATLFEAIQQTPYAIVFLENIDRTPIGTLDLFKDIFTQGYAIDHQGNKYDFRHAIIVITTTLGGERISALTQPHAATDTQTIDLMQLVLSDMSSESEQVQREHFSPQALCDEIMPALETYFTPKLLRHLNIIPFVPLDYAASEKIIKLKLKVFSKQLADNFDIELNYAPEIVRFLVQQILWRQTSKPIDKLLEQNLYSCVAHEIVVRADDTNRPKRLLLQLNDSGQLLRCEFVSHGEPSVYKLG